MYPPYRPRMGAPGVTGPPGMQQMPGAPPAFPGFPPANLPTDINFSAPVIRLGTSGPSHTTPTGADTPRDRDPRRRQGLGYSSQDKDRHHRHGYGHGRDALQLPTKDQSVRTLVISGITEGVGGHDGMERMLQSAGTLRRWIPGTKGDGTSADFCFAEFEPDSLEVAVEVLKDIEVPMKRQPGNSDGHQEEKEVEKRKLSVSVHDGTLSFLENYVSTRQEHDPAELQARFDAARNTLNSVLSDLFQPAKPTRNEEDMAIDADGDSKMAVGEVITLTNNEDDLSDLPDEVREGVSEEISGFRERSLLRDVRRQEREDEIEARQRAQHGRVSAASPPASAPSGPAGGSNGVPLGSRSRAVPNAPAGPKGFGVQIPKEYQKGVSFFNSVRPAYLLRDDDESEASDGELERRRQAKRRPNLDKKANDLERRVIQREMSRAAGPARERGPDEEDDKRLQAVREADLKHSQEFKSAIESRRNTCLFYTNTDKWRRQVMAGRTEERAQDKINAAKYKALLEKEARAKAGESGQAQNQEVRNSASREEPRFKLSLGAAAEKARTNRRRTAAEVEGLLGDEEEPADTTRRPLIPINFDSAAEGADLSQEEQNQVMKQLAADIPQDKDGLWNYDVPWEFVDSAIMTERIMPMIEERIAECVGVPDSMLVDLVVTHLRERNSPRKLVDEIRDAMDDAEDVVRKIWRRVIFYAECEKRGLSL
ncbi:hypothetical protein N7532_000434 [Penicillium argentinense]|uniref:PWI domain-containing protein n=1 Tax=Penicillium argentinense TaxID=1131581 RepID=A0A9W9G578_9EURO|nr:uncharacterized protein N7532_000434 [Penicillium argentinense]KAJ5112389.1 hypothetical protein N7532_000434 [Penicillium argentinense]